MESATTPPAPEFHLDNLRALKVLGKGGMGTVLLVHDSSSDPSALSPFALKLLQKSSINSGHHKLDADHRARWEIDVLTRLSHPFLPSLIGTVESNQLLGWAVPYCPGGDLNVLLHRQIDRVFSPSVIRFYLAEILCALEHLHSLGIAYRDLKPENVLIQQSGHITLTDFDLSHKLTPKSIRTVISTTLPAQENLPDTRRKDHRHFTRWFPAAPENKKGLKKPKSARVSPVSRRKPSFSNGEKSNSFVGTEEYVSPEVVRGDGHEFAVDWWALGVLAFEMLYGKTPFKGSNRKETFRNVLLKSPEFIGKRTVLTDLIERLLEKDPTKRLGYARGACEIKEHEFFRGVRWDLLTEVMRPPFIPPREDGGFTVGGMDISDYFQSLKSPPSFPPSPSSEYQRDVSFAEF